MTNQSQSSLYQLVVTHYLLAACSFLAMAVMLWIASEDLNGHYFHPKLLAITHTAALGWATLIIFGACYQLLPVILETTLYSIKLSWLSLGLFFIGLIFLVFSFWIFEPGIIMQIASVFLLVGIVFFVLNMVLTAKQVKNQNIYQEFMVTASIWLLATAILGLLMVFNFRYPFLPKDHLQFLKMHAHMGIGGWFLLLIMGASAKLIPMFLVSTKQPVKYLNVAYYLINISLLLFLIDTYYAGINFKTYFIALIAACGITAWLAYVLECVFSRMRKTVDLPIWHTLLSFILLVVALIVLPFIIYHQLKENPLAIRNSNLYGTLLLMGWITALILGQTFKTLPYIAWVKHYEHLTGKGNIPLPANLYNNGLLKVQLVVFSLFCLIFYVGLMVKSTLLVKIGLICFLSTALLYVANVLVVVLHKPKRISHETV
jgi:hypothetical protein